MKKKIVFDMDGILFDTEKLSVGCWQEAAKNYDLANIETAITGCVGLNSRDSKKLMEKMYGKNFNYDEFRSKVNQLIKENIEESGIPIKEGALEILSYLKKEEWNIALASSSSIQSVMNHLELAGMTQYFDYMIGGNMVEKSKPHPEIYQIACSSIFADPKDVFAVEDSPNGITSAYSAGMKVIMIPDLIPSSEKIRKMLYKEFLSLLELKAYFERKNL